MLVPLYALGRPLPATREHAVRLGLVTLGQLVTALVAAVETSAPTRPESSTSGHRAAQLRA